MRLFLTSAIAATLLAAPVFAEDSPSPPETASVKEKKLCRSDLSTGSIMPKRTCHTRSEWVEIDAANARNMENYRNQSAQRPDIVNNSRLNP